MWLSTMSHTIYTLKLKKNSKGRKKESKGSRKKKVHSEMYLYTLNPLAHTNKEFYLKRIRRKCKLYKKKQEKDFSFIAS